MSSIRAQVEELGSWITGFEFEGTRYGGDYFPNDDSRVLRFVDAFRQWLRELPDRRRALRILECGCLEGGHTALLAKALDRKSTRLNSSHRCTSYAVFCL